MDSSELITRLTALVAVTLYGLSLLVDRPQGPIEARRAARWFWTAGCAVYLVHVLCAFGLLHEWSHAAAYRHTAARTAQLVGLNWGGGLYFNYLFTAVWLAEVTWWWLAPAGYQTRRVWLRLLLRGSMAFMVLQATVVFGSLPARLLGGAIFVAWTFKLLRQRMQNAASKNAA